MKPESKSLESWIWNAACSIRGARDAPKYKDFILPLIFTKRLCDVFDDELNRIAAEVGSRKKRSRSSSATANWFGSTCRWYRLTLTSRSGRSSAGSPTASARA